MKSRICYNSYIRSICKCPQQCEPAEYDLKTNFAKYPTYTSSKFSTNFPTNLSNNVTLSESIKFADNGVLKLIKIFIIQRMEMQL